MEITCRDLFWGSAVVALAGAAKLDAEQEQIQFLRSEIERLKDELALSKTN